MLIFTIHAPGMIQKTFVNHTQSDPQTTCKTLSDFCDNMKTEEKKGTKININFIEAHLIKEGFSLQTFSNTKGWEIVFDLESQRIELSHDKTFIGKWFINWLPEPSVLEFCVAKTMQAFGLGFTQEFICALVGFFNFADIEQFKTTQVGILLNQLEENNHYFCINDPMEVDSNLHQINLIDKKTNQIFLEYSAVMVESEIKQVINTSILNSERILKPLNEVYINQGALDTQKFNLKIREISNLGLHKSL